MEIRCEVIAGCGNASKAQDSAWGRRVLGDLKKLMGWKRITLGTLNVRVLQKVNRLKPPIPAVLRFRKVSVPVVIVRHRVSILELMAQRHLRTRYKLSDGDRGVVVIGEEDS